MTLAGKCGPAALLIVTVLLMLAVPKIGQGDYIPSNNPSSNASCGSGIADAFYQSYTLGTLKGNSTQIVLGDVVGVKATYGSAATCDIDTVFNFNVLKYVKGNGPSTIYVADSGGTLNGVTVTIKGDPLINVGQMYILFLSSTWNCAPSPPSPPCLLPPTPLDSTFHIVGGAEGKFLISNGLVYSFWALYPSDDHGLGVNVDAVPSDSFLAQVASAGSEPTILGISPTLFYRILVVATTVIIIVLAASVLRRKTKTTARV